MASITLRPGPLFAVASTPSIYLRTQKNVNLSTAAVPQPPIGAAVATATVQGDGTLTYTGLNDDTDYTVYLGGIYLDCSVRNQRQLRFGQPGSVEDIRARGWAGGSSVAETLRRADATANTGVLTSGTLLLAGGCIVPAGTTLSRVGWHSICTPTTCSGAPPIPVG